MGEDRLIESVTSYRLLEAYSATMTRALQGICAPARGDALERRDSCPALTADRRAGIIPVAVVATAGTTNTG